MNLAELSAALREQADELDGRISPQLGPVRARVHRARRRRAIAVSAVGVVAVSVAIVLAGLLPRGTGRLEPTGPPRVVLPQHVQGHHLLQSRIGRPGQERIELSLPVPANDFVVAATCLGPSGHQLDTRLVVNGSDQGGVTCGPDPLLLRRPPLLAGVGLEDLRANGADLTGASLGVSLTLVRGRYQPTPATDADTILALAVYEPDP